MQIVDQEVILNGSMTNFENDDVLREAEAVSHEEFDDAAVPVESCRMDGSEAVQVLLVDDVLTMRALQQSLARLVVAASEGRTYRSHWWSR